MWTELWGALRAEGLRDECAGGSGGLGGARGRSGALGSDVVCLCKVRATVDYCGSLRQSSSGLLALFCCGEQRSESSHSR